MQRARAVVVGVVLLVACTGGGPDDQVTASGTPAPSEASTAALTAGVVLPPPAALVPDALPFLRQRVAHISSRGPQRIDARVVQPDGPAFVVDVASVLAGDGRDLVCLVGSAASADLVELAAGHTGTQFCALGRTASELPPNLWAPRPRHREAAWLVGAAAALVAGDGTVGMVVREGQPAIAAKRAAVARGRQAVLDAGAAPSPSPTPGPLEPPIVGTIALQDEQAAPVVDAVLSQDPGVLLVDVGPLLPQVVDLLAEQAPELPVIAWVGSSRAGLLPGHALVVAEDELLAFELALGAVVAGTTADLPQTLGMAEGLWEIRPSDPAASPPVLEQLDPWIARIISGDLDVNAPPDQ